MNKTLKFVVPVILLASVTSFSASAGNSDRAGGFGQTVCELPSGKIIFVPWHYCKMKGGKGEKTDF
ncbi:hypothetical protein [Photobacterium kasasachensis]|uniref:hypothetical protein n=1 Tax=Photobacterium kasasachensis TaxID=2910240 RepID=UPI003D1305DD